MGRYSALLRRAASAVGVLYAFGPHLTLIKLLGPRWGLRWARLNAWLHWLLTLALPKSRTWRAMERLRDRFDTDASTAVLMRRHLELKHHSFAEWRLSVTKRGRRYLRETYGPVMPYTDERLAELLSEGRGLLFVVFHFGMYKMLAGAAAARYDVEVFKAHLVSAHYSPSTLGPVAQLAFQNAVRTDRLSGSKNIYLRPDSRPLSLVRCLRRGHVLGIAADGMVARNFTHAPFLGGRLRLPVGWAKLAAATQAPVVFMFASLKGVHGRQLDVSEPFRVENTEEGVQAAVQRGARLLEKHVRQRPWDWHIWRRLEFHQRDGELLLSADPVNLDPDSFYYEPPPK